MLHAFSINRVKLGTHTNGNRYKGTEGVDHMIKFKSPSMLGSVWFMNIKV
jgi:hypothetical protein